MLSQKLQGTRLHAVLAFPLLPLIDACRSRGMLEAMVILHVHIRVRPELTEAFQEATLQNARQSVQEPGCLRFDVAQQSDDPTRYLLIEVYRDEAAIEAHRQTPHFAKWREAAEPMMAEPRTRSILKPLFPTEEESW